MKKKIFCACILLFISIGFNNVSAKYEEAVLRNILTDIVWNQDKHQIEVKFFSIQYIPGQGVQSYATSHIIKSDSFNYEEMNDEKAITFVLERSFSDIYKSDYIFGFQVDLYMDLLGNNFTEEEFEEVVKQAELDISTTDYSFVLNKSETGIVAEKNNEFYNGGMHSAHSELISQEDIYDVKESNNDNKGLQNHYLALIPILLLLIVGMVFKIASTNK